MINNPGTSNENLPLTTTAASTYQQLRGHLAALERLLALEVDATEARRLAGRLRFACLPSIDPRLIAELGTCRCHRAAIEGRWACSRSFPSAT